MNQAAERDAAVLDLERQIRRLRAEQAAIIIEVERAGLHIEDGHRSANSWVQAVLNCSRSTACGLLRDARVIADLPVLRAAVDDVGADQLRILSNLYSDRRCRHSLPDSAGLLTRLARDLVHADFVTASHRWRAHVDPDGSHRAHVEARRGRKTVASTVGSDFELRVRGDALAGAIVSEILREHEHAEFLTDIADRRDRYGTNAALYPLSRTCSQRRFDALVQIFLKAAATTDITNRKPLVNLVTTPDALEAGLRHLLPIAETADGSAVSPAAIALAALVGEIRRVAVDDNAQVTAVGRRRRLFTGRVRQAVFLDNQRCQFPGCLGDTDLQADHLVPRSVGGPTEPANGGVACGHHNRFRHQRGITVARDQAGWHYYRRDGTEIAPRGRPDLSSIGGETIDEWTTSLTTP